MRSFPAFGGMKIAERWAGVVDATPDGVPVISEVPSLPGFYIASGFSGHGFGIGPGAGHLMADLVMGETPIVDPAPYRYGPLASKVIELYCESDVAPGSMNTLQSPKAGAPASPMQAACAVSLGARAKGSGDRSVTQPPRLMAVSAIRSHFAIVLPSRSGHAVKRYCRNRRLQGGSVLKRPPRYPQHRWLKLMTIRLESAMRHGLGVRPKPFQAAEAHFFGKVLIL